jgi:hypothetical protein
MLHIKISSDNNAFHYSLVLKKLLFSDIDEILSYSGSLFRYSDYNINFFTYIFCLIIKCICRTNNKI